MVRISGGQFRGRQLHVPRSGVRPTKDIVREALFSVLGESVVGRRVADVFAGSGVVGLEALSRGAAECCWVEKDPATFNVLRRNVAQICGDRPTGVCVKADAVGWLKSGAGPSGFDLLYADPPYTRDDGRSWAEILLELIAAGTRLAPDGLFVMEQRAREPVIDNPAWNRLKEKAYGDARLVYYRRVSA